MSNGAQHAQRFQAHGVPTLSTSAVTPTRLILVRHGETALTAKRRYSGRGDIPLSRHGEKQARAAAARVARLADDVAVVVSSPLSRCTQTGSAIAASVCADVTTEPALIECDFGAWEGLTYAQVRSRYPAELAAWLGDTSHAPPGGESFDEVAARVRPAVAGLLEAYSGLTVVVVTHISPIKLVLCDALHADISLLYGYRLHLDPASVSIVDSWPDGDISVRGVNLPPE